MTTMIDEIGTGIGIEGMIIGEMIETGTGTEIGIPTETGIGTGIGEGMMIHAAGHLPPLVIGSAREIGIGIGIELGRHPSLLERRTIGPLVDHLLLLLLVRLRKRRNRRSSERSWKLGRNRGRSRSWQMARRVRRLLRNQHQRYLQLPRRSLLSHSLPLE
jgi:hypothetical protein